MSGPRFVVVPRDALLGELESIGAAIASRGGSFEVGRSGGEVVVDLVPPGGRAMVRVYSSIAVRAEEARPCGEDAVRVLVCVRVADGIRTLEPTTKILRTAPKGSDAERLAAFLGRVRDRVRDSYRLAVRRPCCPSCGRAMARREAKASGSPFLGCIAYPECRGTAPVV